jgi:hypothetical protein
VTTCRAMACRATACRAVTCSAWRCPRWASSSRDRVGVQGGGARCGKSCSAAAAGRFAREQWGRAWGTSEAVEEKATEGTALMQTDHGPRGGGGAVMMRRAGRRGGEAKAATGCDELEGARCSQARRTPFIHAEVEAGATQRGFDAQRKTGGGGRPALMASQQEERAVAAHAREQRRLSP